MDHRTVGRHQQPQSPVKNILSRRLLRSGNAFRLQRNHKLHYLPHLLVHCRLPCFRSTLADTLQSALAQLNNDDGTPTDVDIDKLAQQVWTDLWWHLAEG